MEENKREVIGARSEKQHQFLTNTADVVVFGGGCASQFYQNLKTPLIQGNLNVETKAILSEV